MRKILVFITALALSLQPLIVAAEEVVPSKLEVEIALARLGLPVGKVDGEYDDKTFRATCAWRLITGEVAVFGKPLKRERAVIVGTTAFAKPQMLSVGLHVNLTCQTLIWIDRLWKNNIGIGYRVIVKGNWVSE
jgi:hypothetical protein